MIDYLYCFDKNYNIQAYCSLFSLLECSSEKINVHILHNEPESFKEIYNLVNNHDKLNKINFYKFDNSGINFPKVDGSHVSEATYYRIFIEKYLPENLKNIVYIDADIICQKDPTKDIKSTLQVLEKSDHIISVRTEHYKNKKNANVYERLLMNNEKYFNAGVMLIDLNKWRENSLTKVLRKKMNEISELIELWDQDILNHYFDGKYNELNNNLNFNLYLTEKNSKIKASDESLNQMIFLHYSGSYKPWTVRGVYNRKSIYYHLIFRKLFSEKFHITTTYRLGSLLQFFKGIVNLDILYLKNKISFIKITMKTIFSKYES